MATAPLQKSPPQPEAPPPAPTGIGGRIAGLRGALATKFGGVAKQLRRNKKVAILAAGVMACVLLPAFILPKVLPKAPPKPKDPPNVAAALETLDRQEFTAALALADDMAASGQLKPNELGVPPYIRGAIAAHQAEMFWDKDRKNYYLLASRHLQQAREAGFPPDREGLGIYLLAKSLFESDQFATSRPALEQALREDPEHRTEVHGMLTQVYLRGSNRDLKQALSHNSEYLADEQLPVGERQNGLLLRGEILLKLDDLTACRKTLESIAAKGAAGASAAVIRGQLLMNEAHTLKADAAPEGREARLAAATTKYQEAIAVFRQAQVLGSRAVEAGRRGMYLIGLCYFEMGDLRAALEQWARTAKVAPESNEGMAANLQQADLLRQSGRDDEALAAYRDAAEAAGDANSYSNAWISLPEFRTRLMTAFQQYIKADNFERAIQITDLMHPLLPLEEPVELAAQAHDAWARFILAQMEGKSPQQVIELQREARRQLRLAGQVYGRLAELRLASRDYTEALWLSGQAYFEGHDYRSAVSTFNDYLRYELRKRRPRVLVNLGESQLALGRIDQALTVLRECIEFYPSDSASYQARILASRAFWEQSDRVDAEALLRENLDGGGLAPASREWRDSLFALGRLLQAAGDQDEAVLRLEEAVARYPDAPQALESRYLIAESYRKAAEVPREKLQADTIETARIAHAKQMQSLLNQALGQYEKVEQILGRRQQRSELSPLEQSILRNCYFSRGMALFDLGRYDDAIQAYSTATNRYQHAPESLEAFVQIATCYRRLNKNEKARGTLEQAKVVLSRIRPEANFRDTTNYSQQEWVKLLDWLETL